MTKSRRAILIEVADMAKALADTHDAGAERAVDEEAMQTLIIAATTLRRFARMLADGAMTDTKQRGALISPVESIYRAVPADDDPRRF